MFKILLLACLLPIVIAAENGSSVKETVGKVVDSAKKAIENTAADLNAQDAERKREAAKKHVDGGKQKIRRRPATYLKIAGGAALLLIAWFLYAAIITVRLVVARNGLDS